MKVPTRPTMEEEPIWRMLDHAPNLFLCCLLGSVVSGVILTFGFSASWVVQRWKCTPPPPLETSA